jgi:hypothetical protein
MQTNIHNVNKITALPISNFGNFATRDFLFTSSEGEELKVKTFGNTPDDVTLKAIIEQRV